MSPKNLRVIGTGVFSPTVIKERDQTEEEWLLTTNGCLEMDVTGEIAENKKARGLDTGQSVDMMTNEDHSQKDRKTERRKKRECWTEKGPRNGTMTQEGGSPNTNIESLLQSQKIMRRRL